jgi:hypothetical protein
MEIAVVKTNVLPPGVLVPTLDEFGDVKYALYPIYKVHELMGNEEVANAQTSN